MICLLDNMKLKIIDYSGLQGKNIFNSQIEKLSTTPISDYIILRDEIMIYKK